MNCRRCTYLGAYERMYFQANDITLGAFHAYVKEQQDVAP